MTDPIKTPADALVEAAEKLLPALRDEYGDGQTTDELGTVYRDLGCVGWKGGGKEMAITFEMLDALEDALAAYRASPSPAESGWRTIDSCPAYEGDGPTSFVWAYWPTFNGVFRAVERQPADGEWWRYRRACGDRHPTHWRPTEAEPLPPAPEGGADNG